MASRETRARGEVPAVVERRPGTAAPDNRFGRKRPARCHGAAACTLEERRPRHSSSSGEKRRARLFPIRNAARRNRRAPGASSGGLHGNDGRLRPEMLCCPPVAAIVRSPTVPPPISGTAASRRLSASICVICGFYRRAGGGLPVGFQIHLRIHGIERHRRFELGERNLVVDGVRMELIGRTEADRWDAENARNSAPVG